MTQDEENLFEIARRWAIEAPPGETTYRFKRVWGWRIQKHLDESREIIKKLLENFVITLSYI